jgi:hypothetical protein
MLNYITDSYPSVAASAIAAFSLPSFTIAAGLVHAGIAMFENMTTTWAVFILSHSLLCFPLSSTFTPFSSLSDFSLIFSCFVPTD